MLYVRQERNIRFDFGSGNNTDGNFYVNIAEVY